MNEKKVNCLLLITTVLIITTCRVTVVNSTVTMTSSTEALLGGTARLVLTWENEKIHSVKIEHANSALSGEYHAECNIHPITHSCISCKNGRSFDNLQANCHPKRIAWMFSPLRLSNDGMYRITLSRLNDNAIHRTSYIYVHESPSDISLNCDYKMCKSNTISCECRAQPGNPKAFIRWTLTRKNKVLIDLTDRSSTSQKNNRIYGTLSYDVNKVDHNSILSCEAINKHDAVKRDYVIKYRDKPVILPNFENHLVLHESSKRTISCRASGHPQPTIKWQLPDGGEILRSEIQMSDLKHRPGIYSCVAQNCFGNDTRRTEIIVQSSPVCTSVYEKIITVAESLYGTSVKMVCKVASNPESKIYWTTLPVWTEKWLNLSLKGFTIDEYQEGNDKFSSLTINCLNVRHLGSYKCQAKNLLGSCFRTMQLRKAENKELNDLRIQLSQYQTGVECLSPIMALIIVMYIITVLWFKKILPVDRIKLRLRKIFKIRRRREDFSNTN